jgi:hypothetical protein
MAQINVRTDDARKKILDHFLTDRGITLKRWLENEIDKIGVRELFANPKTRKHK